MKKSGFSLIEMLVVIVVMGMLAGLSVFSYRTIFAKSRLEETMNRVRAFYEGVNKRAVTEGYSYAIQIDKEDNFLKYISADGSRRDILAFREGLDLEFDGGENPISLIVYVDGFVRDVNDIRNFSVTDTALGKSIDFYISPLGVLEASLR
jgi:prepilin-type N-terminal cleavage/methylation domain-containing protein